MAVKATPSLRQARMMRMAISPRLATSTLCCVMSTDSFVSTLFSPYLPCGKGPRQMLSACGPCHRASHGKRRAHAKSSTAFFCIITCRHNASAKPIRFSGRQSKAFPEQGLPTGGHMRYLYAPHHGFSALRAIFTARNTFMQNPQDVQRQLHALRALCPQAAPRVAIVLGTGLGALAEAVENAVSIPYDALPDFPRSTVASHAGRFVLGQLEGVPVICQRGRCH